MDVGNYSPISFDLPTAKDGYFEPFPYIVAQDQQPPQSFYASPLSVREWPASSPVSTEPIIDKVVMRVVPKLQNGFSIHHADVQGPIQFQGPPMIDQVVMQIPPRNQQSDQPAGYVFNHSFAPRPEWQSPVDLSPPVNPTPLFNPSPPFNLSPPVGDQMDMTAEPQPAPQDAGKSGESTRSGVETGRGLRCPSEEKWRGAWRARSRTSTVAWEPHASIARRRAKNALGVSSLSLASFRHTKHWKSLSRAPAVLSSAVVNAGVTGFGNPPGENASDPGRSWPTSPDDIFLGYEQASFPTSVLWSPPAESSRGQPQSKIQSAIFQNYTRRFESPMKWWIARLSSLPHTDPTNSPREVRLVPSLMEMAQKLDGDLMSWHQESAWRVLKTAIAAFGSQGIDPGSNRWQPKYGFDNGCRPEFWTKAKASIDNSPDVLSFQVILAHFIVGMIHFPASEYDESFAAEAPSGISFPRQDSRKVGNRFIRRGISDLFQLIRQVRDGPATGFTATPLGQRYLKSIFSLGLFLDTISSAVDGRPVLIHDEDCAIILGEPTQGPSAEQTSGLWHLSRLQIKVKVVKTDDGRQHIDCHSRLGEEGAPITVLLFRKVTQLQALLFRRRPQSELEASILEAIDVYNHGNKRYGGLSSDPLSVCDSSCTINLGIRWHLACLLLAVVIERIERVMKPSAFSEKLRSHLWNLRMKAVFIISGLANLSIPGPGSEHASVLVAEKVAEAFLDDPWIQLLINAMQQALKVSETWRKEGYTVRTPHMINALSPSEISCLDCIKRLGAQRPCE
ncbi:uncharacterized protein Z520_12288 [Fonsecaea multimorphosa CBS 102226]|uniref:Transcription factor domain-containing protein n=1 Tax=Fonsecaea multimorphosa CBS 102226 TaxID=1442371 RepID=A0A0D2JFS0_9EURO|nr:uncharacterized protein Z520_12288 [Fonsecaea multimorphosa CBS 102226]KIX92017.1 hypothetical protein Z520_12288 [Fonsecaea multimorphosa CBS 102226]